MLTLCVVTCYKDIELFLRWLDTTLYAWPVGLDEIIVVINELDGLSEFKSRSEPIIAFRHRRIPIRWVMAETILGHRPLAFDWHSQQQVKLCLAEWVETKWYVIHDSKDYYVSLAGREVFIDQGQLLRSTTPISTITGVGRAYHYEYSNSYRLWGLTLGSHPLAIKHHPPAIFAKATMQAMISDLKVRTGDLFEHLTYLSGHHGALYTEFGLMSAWLTYTGDISQYVGTPPDKLDITHWVRWDKDLRPLELMDN